MSLVREHDVRSAGAKEGRKAKVNRGRHGGPGQREEEEEEVVRRVGLVPSQLSRCRHVDLLHYIGRR